VKCHYSPFIDDDGDSGNSHDDDDDSGDHAGEDMQSVEAVSSSDAEEARVENTRHQPDVVPLSRGARGGQGTQL